MQKSTVLVSACLLGVKCRYNAVCGMVDGLEELMECAQLIPVCPETLGGLPTPRPPAERVGNRVVNCEGGDVTRPYVEGAQECLKLARIFGAQYALMKERSPSCGAGEIYDGTFSHTRVSGDGVASEMLKQAGIAVYGESRIRELIDLLKEGNAK